MSWLNKLRVGLALIVLALAGCTVVPKTFQPGGPSYDTGERNSGLLGQLPDHSAVITPHARDRYNGLIEVYGSRFIPPLIADAGVSAFTNGTWRIDPEHLVDFATMNRWRKQSTSGP